MDLLYAQTSFVPLELSFLCSFCLNVFRKLCVSAEVLWREETEWFLCAHIARRPGSVRGNGDRRAKHYCRNLIGGK